MSDDKFIEQLDALRNFVYTLDTLDEGSYEQALFVLDNSPLSKLNQSASNIILDVEEELGYKGQDRSDLRDRVRNRDYV